MKTEVRKITPSIAEEMLKRNVSNRGLNTNHVKGLSKEMIDGNWMFDGQPIRFSENGGLLDGQHRLSAVVKSGLSQEFLILTGISSEAFKVMDSGKTRSGADIFSIDGVTNYALAAASCKLILIHKKGSNRLTDGSERIRISNTSMLSFYNETPTLKKWVSEAGHRRANFSNVLTATEISALSFLMGERNTTDSEMFWDSLCSGLGLLKGSPILALRNKLIKNKLSDLKMTAVYKKAIIIKAWNYYRLSKNITYLNYSSEKESFPTIL
tara:strand:- start:462 stop:1265 length:804 start_codon:yes stop_codon:yes gene_type:complete